jgi:hypothetical protein
MKKFRPSLLLTGAIGLCAALAPVSGRAQRSLHLFPSSMGELTTAPYNNRQTFTFPTPSVSLASYGGIRVTFNAPTGFAWRVDPSKMSGLECYILYGSSPTPDQIGYGGTHYSFDFVPGMSGTVSIPWAQSDQSWDSETGFGLDVDFWFGGTVEFTSFTVSEAHYVSLDMYQRQLLLSPFVSAYLDGGSAQVRGGLTLVPIPEPGAVALVPLGLGAMMVFSGPLRRPLP